MVRSSEAVKWLIYWYVCRATTIFIVRCHHRLFLSSAMSEWNIFLTSHVVQISDCWKITSDKQATLKSLHASVDLHFYLCVASILELVYFCSNANRQKTCIEKLLRCQVYPEHGPVDSGLILATAWMCNHDQMAVATWVFNSCRECWHLDPSRGCIRGNPGCPLSDGNRERILRDVGEFVIIITDVPYS
jgi:hypothetical protein